MTTTRHRHAVSLAAATGAIATFILCSGFTAASAAATPAQDPVAVLAAASPEALTNTTTSPVSNTPNAEQKLAVDSVPTLALAPGAASAVTISAPFGDVARQQPTDQAGVTAYDNGNGTSTVAVNHTDGSVAFNTVVWDQAAPATYSYALDLPSGATLRQNASGTISILDAHGAWTGGVKPAWARDAEGNVVPTHYEISGSTLTQVVDFSQPGVVFPVVADPWFGQDLIDHVTWVPGDPQWGPPQGLRATGLADWPHA
jgi:hypothetical protein